MTPQETTTELERVRELICRFLGSASVADHLGDIRYSEEYLWSALGINRADLAEARGATGYDDSALPLARHLAIEFELPFLDYILEDYEDE